MNSTTCELNCSTIGGHIPYLYEVDSVVSDLIKNETINATTYPIFTERKHSTVENARKFAFHISATYNFQSKTWKSGGFQIRKNYWAETNPNEDNFPILNDRLLLHRGCSSSGGGNEVKFFWESSNDDQFWETGRLHGDEGAKMDSWHSRVKVSQNLSVRLDQNQKFAKK